MASHWTTTEMRYLEARMRQFADSLDQDDISAAFAAYSQDETGDRGMLVDNLRSAAYTISELSRIMDSKAQRSRSKPRPGELCNVVVDMPWISVFQPEPLLLGTTATVRFVCGDCGAEDSFPVAVPAADDPVWQQSSGGLPEVYARRLGFQLMHLHTYRHNLDEALVQTMKQRAASAGLGCILGIAPDAELQQQRAGELSKVAADAGENPGNL